MASHRSSAFYYCSTLLVLLSCRRTEALIKEWSPLDSDWQNRNNWDGGRLPCWRSRVVLPEEVVISVFVNGSVAWSELVMPQTGELVLDDLTLAVDDTQQPCPLGEVKFKNWRPASWFDPDRWRIAQVDGLVIQQPLAIPHSERIPCAHDSVHLTKRHSLSVDFNRVHSLTVGQVKYDDQPLTVEEWRDRLNGPEWRYQVHNPPRSVYVNGTDCRDALGCRCGHDVDVMQMVCSNAGVLCTNQLECPNSFRPPGHCCDMCGAMMKLTVDERIFTKSSLDRFVSSSILSEDGWASSQSYSYRTDENVLHLIVADNTTNEQSIRLARRIQDYLDKDRATGNLYGIVALEVITSGPSRPATHHLSPEELHLIASNLATVFATFLVVAAVGAGFYFLKKHRLTGSRDEPSVGFARFQNDSSANVEIAIDASFEQAMARPPLEQSGPSSSPFEEAAVLPEIPVDASPTSRPLKVPAAWKKFTRAFSNPLFGDPSVGRMSGRWTMSSLMKSATQENPIYNMEIGGASEVTVGTDAEIPVSSADGGGGGGDDETTERGVNVTPLVDTLPADDDDDALPAVDETMEDVAMETTVDAANGKHPLKRLWKQATKKRPAKVADPAVLSTRHAEPDETPRQPAEDEMQLTLAEETDDW